MQNTKNIYIILSRSKTPLARIIQLVTGRFYNHSSLALDESCAVFYSFGRRNPLRMFPAGFIIEGVDDGFFKFYPDVPIAVYEIPVPADDYTLICQRLAPFIADPLAYKYSIVNLFYQYFGIAHPLEKEYVCSAFIATILDGIVDTGKEPSLVYPHDFQALGYKMVYEGLVGAYTAHYQQKMHGGETLSAQPLSPPGSDPA
ncbi:hypothetical protein LJB77_01425 [Ruminococcaceae bacterium OttesenSCG-928-N02]|nr:hypothetical protein [Ruminococcaceae bacterium OttesenSCG-928-N02]